MTLKKFADISVILQNLDDPIYCLDYLVNWTVELNEFQSLTLDAHTELYQQLYKLMPSDQSLFEKSVFGKHYHRLLGNFFSASPTETTLIWHYLQDQSKYTNLYDNEDLFGYFINVIEYLLMNNDTTQPPKLPINVCEFDALTDRERLEGDLNALNMKNNDLWNYCMYLMSVKSKKDSNAFLHRMGGYIPAKNTSNGKTQILFGLMLQSIHWITSNLDSLDKKQILRDAQFSLEEIKMKSKDLQLTDYEHIANRLSMLSKQVTSVNSFYELINEKSLNDMELYLEQLRKYCYSFELSNDIQNRQIPLFLRSFYEKLHSDFSHQTKIAFSLSNESLLTNKYTIECCELIIMLYSGYPSQRIYISVLHLKSEFPNNQFLIHLCHLAYCLVCYHSNIYTIDSIDDNLRAAYAHGDGLLSNLAFCIRGLFYYKDNELSISFHLLQLGLNGLKRYLGYSHIRDLFNCLFYNYLQILINANRLSYIDKINYFDKKIHVSMDNPTIPHPT